VPTTTDLRNTAMLTRRTAAGLSFEKLAMKVRGLAAAAGEPVGTLASVTRHLKRIEAGEVEQPRHGYQALIAQALGCRISDLFDEIATQPAAPGALSVTSHKFVPAFLGAPALNQAATRLGALAADGARRAVVERDGVSVPVWLYPWGVAIAHLTEPVEAATIADLAGWRVASYPRDMAWLSDLLTDAAGQPVEAGYVLSAYWLHRGPWAGDRLATAVRLLSMPRVLLGESQPQHAAGADECERRLLRSGFEHPGIVEFGVPGTALGAASWSSVAYHPLVAARALAPADLIEVELLTQALWCYARAICDRVEQGGEPDVPAEFGVRFLRAMRSRCATARPQESSAHQTMRRAIVQTSGLCEQIDTAMTALADL
jgi:transcriptional regulator with XRE-family HTH domain